MALSFSDPPEPRAVTRRCPVCDWIGSVIVGTPDEEICPQCYAATVIEPEGGAGEATGETAKNPHAAALGRLGGKRGGRARAKKLSPARRKQIARKAALARWRKSR
jgi:ribosomal protein S27E